MFNFKNHSQIKELLKQASTIVMTCHWLVSFFRFRFFFLYFSYILLLMCHRGEKEKKTALSTKKEFIYVEFSRNEEKKTKKKLQLLFMRNGAKCTSKFSAWHLKCLVYILELMPKYSFSYPPSALSQFHSFSAWKEEILLFSHEHSTYTHLQI